MAKYKGKPKSNRGLWFVVGGAVVVVGALITFSILAGQEKPAPDAGTPITVKKDSEVKGTRNQQGDPQAKVQIVEWGDYL